MPYSCVMVSLDNWESPVSSVRVMERHLLLSIRLVDYWKRLVIVQNLVDATKNTTQLVLSFQDLISSGYIDHADPESGLFLFFP